MNIRGFHFVCRLNVSLRIFTCCCWNWNTQQKVKIPRSLHRVVLIYFFRIFYFFYVLLPTQTKLYDEKYMNIFILLSIFFSSHFCFIETQTRRRATLFANFNELFVCTVNPHIRIIFIFLFMYIFSDIYNVM